MAGKEGAEASRGGERSQPVPRAEILLLAGKRPATKALLIEAGERLVSRSGVEGVALREIAALAGQSNSNVVQYHFGDKKGLIQAIFEDRVGRLETLRSEGLAALKAAGLGRDARALLSLLWLPSLTFRDDEGSYVFCRFQLQCWLQPEYMSHSPVGERYQGSVLAEIVALLREHYRTAPADLFSRRLAALSLMFISCAVEFDSARTQAPGEAEFDAGLLLDMAVTALAAPAIGPEGAPQDPK
jgi:AcrR family transcriptional regulator